MFLTYRSLMRTGFHNLRAQLQNFFLSVNCRAVNGLRLFIVFVFLLGPLRVSAQRELKKYLNPIAPNVASFEKYGNIPINYSTGQISQNINLYTLDIDENLKIPISLSYSSSGMKPDDIPTWVGHGWDLMPGGYIMQEIRGANDLMPGGLFRDQNMRTSLQSYLNGVMSDPTQKYNYIKNVLNGNGDTQQDVFSLNLLGKIVKFYFDGTVPRFIEHEPYKLEFTLGSGFFVTDEKGYKFRFSSSSGNSGTSVTDPDGGFPTGGAWTWNLDEVITPNNESVTFQYVPDVVYAIDNRNTSFTFGASSITDAGSGYGCYSSFSGPKTSVSTTTVAQSILKMINFKGRTVNFGTVVRNDVLGLSGTKANALAAIQITNEYNQIIKSIVLGYDNNSRLRLDQLTITDPSSNAAVQRYGFEYYGDLTTVPLITGPGRTYGMDHWGYYNGANNSPFSVTDVDYSTFIPGLLSRFGHNNNSPNGLSVTGMLHRISYPAGGYTEIDYEPNQISFNSLARNTYLDFVNRPLSTQILLANTNCEEGAGGGTGGGGYESGIFTVDHQIDAAEINWSLVSSNMYQATCKVQKIENGNVVQAVMHENTASGTSAAGSKYYALSPGTYQYILDSGCDESTTQNSIVLYIGEDKLPPEGMIVNVGGNRVLRVKDFDYAGHIAGVRKFRYAEAQLNQYPKYVDTYDVIAEPLGQSPWAHTVCGPAYTIGNRNLTPQLGFPITYKQVTELLGENGENGKTVYFYGSEAIIGGDYANPPYPAAIPLSWRNGDIIKKEIYQKSGATFNKIQVTSYTYTPTPPTYLQSPEILKGINFGIKANVVLGSENPLHYYEYFNSGNVYLPTDRHAVLSVSDTTFNNDGSSVIEQRSNSYNSNDFLLSSVIKTGSSGQLLEKKIWYANDFNNLGNIATLKSNNIIGVPLKEINSSSGNIVSGEVYTRDNSGNILQIHEYENTSLVAVPLHDPSNYYPQNFVQKTILNYTANGKLKDYKDTDGVPVGILWGYNNSYPIAEVKNATYQSLVNALGQNLIDQLNGNNPGSDEQIRISLAALRSSLPNAQVTVYTYKPLVGMTSVTDPKGMTTYYEYDNFQRLLTIKDQNGHIVKSYDYHFKP
jgi:YD repeat-containing protein